jgi:nitroreductase
MSTVFDLEQTDKLLSTTRAVRKRLDFTRPVERQVLLDCVRLSQQAPTGSNTQFWRWVIVLDEDKRRQVGAIYARGAEFIDQLKSQLPEEDAQTHRVYDSAGYLFEHIHEVPALVIPCVVGRPADPTDHATVASTYGSILPAVWSFQLALRSRGLGSAWTTLHLMWEREVAEILDIPEEVMQVALLPVAYTLGTDFKPARRQPPEEIVHWDGWSD